MTYKGLAFMIVFGVLACSGDPDPAAEDGGSGTGSETAEGTATSSGESESESESGTETETETTAPETETETGETGTEEEPIYPDPDWEMGIPEDHGLSSEGLEALAEVAEGLPSNCLVVVHEGVLVGEWYWNNYDADTDQPNVYSVTKSVTSALVGIAENQGLLGLNDSASDYITEWAGGESDVVTIRNLISNDSGREWSFTTDYVGMTAAADQTQFAIDLGQDHPPGAWWEYNNSAIQTLERVLEVATGEDVEDYAQAHLFQPIGMTVSMTRDQSGNPQTYQGLSASCRDLARFGYLFLRQGEWAGGQQIVPADWVYASTVPSTPLNTAYGFMWWLNVDGHWVLPSTPLREEGDGKLFPEAPEAMFSAVGAFGQAVVVDPTSGYVFVRLGDAIDVADLTGFSKLEALWEAFAAAKL
jgi:CubicO group peptidase (beta-lactamase class C family)